MMYRTNTNSKAEETQQQIVVNFDWPHCFEDNFNYAMAAD